MQAKFGDKLKPINDGVEREGAFYLFALRLVPAFPFFVINLVMGLTPITTRTFYWVSQAGMFAGTIVYVYAGTQLAQISSLKDVLSPGLIGAFVHPRASFRSSRRSSWTRSRHARSTRNGRARRSTTATWW